MNEISKKIFFFQIEMFKKNQTRCLLRFAVNTEKRQEREKWLKYEV